MDDNRSDQDVANLIVKYIEGCKVKQFKAECIGAPEGIGVTLTMVNGWQLEIALVNGQLAYCMEKITVQ